MPRPARMGATGPGYYRAVASRVTVLERLTAGRSYPQIGRDLGIAPGLAYLVATGLPADGSPPIGHQPTPMGWLPQGGTHLANPPAAGPTEEPGLVGWVAARAAADPAMAAAGQGEEPAGVPGVGDDDDVVVAVRTEHHAIRRLVAELCRVPARGSHQDALRRASVTKRLGQHLSAHEAAEDHRLWPAVRDGVPNGQALARHARWQERQTGELLHRLSRLPADSSQRLALTDELLDALRAHLAFEDSVLLALEQAVAPQQRRTIGSLGGRRARDDR